MSLFTGIGGAAVKLAESMLPVIAEEFTEAVAKHEQTNALLKSLGHHLVTELTKIATNVMQEKKIPAPQQTVQGLQK